MKTVETEATAWNWTCPDEDCERENDVDSTMLDWSETPWVVTCVDCKKEFEPKI